MGVQDNEHSRRKRVLVGFVNGSICEGTGFEFFLVFCCGIVFISRFVNDIRITIERGVIVYRTGQKYKIETTKGIFYTGTILEESDTHVMLVSSVVRGEEVILSKTDIRRAVMVRDEA